MSGASRPRLSLAHLPELAGRPVTAPPVDPAALSVGIVHLGIGAFHRAHQAVYTEEAMAATGDTAWAICGVTQRSATVYDQLAPQDGLFTVLERGRHTTARVVAAVRQVRTGGHPTVTDRIADPAVRVVTVTVTERGYRLRPDGRLDLADPAVAHDLAGLGVAGFRPQSMVGQVVAGLRARRLTHGAGLSVLSCDNLSDNGRVLQRTVSDFCAALPEPAGADLADWLAGAVRFPASMVDRIVPATREPDRGEVAGLLGAEDAGVVVAEPYRQWVIEDDFAGARPAWEAAGAVLTADVTPYELVKLRMVNATHSLLAYAGALAGHDTIAEAVADPALAAMARRYLVEDASPTLTAPPGVDLPAYREQVLNRFANPALGHRTVQVAADGSVKLPIRLLPVLRQRLEAGAVPQSAAFAVAAWILFVALGQDRRGRALPLRDSLAPRLRAAFQGHGTAGGLVDAALSLREVFPSDLAGDPTLRALLRRQVNHHLTRPVRPIMDIGS